MCNREHAGIKYGRVVKPGPATHGYSVDVVEMDDVAGGHHRHPNGEIDLVMPVDGTPRFDGHGAGWLVYEPGTAHRADGHRRQGARCSICCRRARSSSRNSGIGAGRASARAASAYRRSAMPSLSTADHGLSPPRVDIPRDYNAAHDLVERNLAAGRAGKIAYIDDAGHATRTASSPSASTAAPTRSSASACSPSSACSSACSTPSTFRRRSSARSRPASCRSPATRCSRPRTTSTCCATAARGRWSSRRRCCRRSRRSSARCRT